MQTTYPEQIDAVRLARKIARKTKRAFFANKKDYRKFDQAINDAASSLHAFNLSQR